MNKMLHGKEQKYSPLPEDDLLDRGSHAAEVWRRRFFFSLWFFTGGALLLVILLFQLRGNCSCSRSMGDVVQPYSPAEGHIAYVNRYLTQDPETHKFMGKPRPELDEAWHSLLEGTLIRISDEDLQKAGNATSVAHKEGGFVAGLGISHSLHCLKRIKQYINPDYYYSHEAQDWEELQYHAEHCLESLRQSVLCQADLSLYTLEWTPHSRVKPTVRVPEAHACVDWPKLHEWMKSRAAKADDMVPPPPELYEDSPRS